MPRSGSTTSSPTPWRSSPNAVSPGVMAVGWVSRSSDDHGDDVVLEPVGRFAAIAEDAPVRLPLRSERDAAGAEKS